MFEIIGFAAVAYLLVGAVVFTFKVATDAHFRTSFLRDIREVAADSFMQVFLYVFCGVLVWPLVLYKIIPD